MQVIDKMMAEMGSGDVPWYEKLAVDINGQHYAGLYDRVRLLCCARVLCDGGYQLMW